MKFELDTFHRNIAESELLADLKRAYDLIKHNGKPLTCRSYDEIGKYKSSTLSARFGSWNNALQLAGLSVNRESNASDEDLFLNLEFVWESLGRQPVSRDLVKPISKYGKSAYENRFGGWRQSLVAFIRYINSDAPEEKNEIIEEISNSTSIVKIRRTSRNISDRMRFRILSRDGFTCQSCGASPIKVRGIELHIDHIIPWSIGGETIEENLQTKCQQCNLGKGNAFNQ